MRAQLVELVGGHGGMDYYDDGLCRGLSGAGVDVELSTGTFSVPDSGRFEVRRPFESVFENGISTRRRISRFARALMSTAYRVAFRRAPVVHLQWFHVGPLELAVTAAMVLLRRKVVVTLHDIEPLAERAGASSPLVRRCAEALIDAWIVHNELCREMLAHRLGIDPSEIAVIPHGNYPCDSQPLPTRAEARALLSLPSGGPIVLFFGHIKAVKGLDLLIEATARLRRSGTRIHVVIAGKTWKEEFEPYQAQIDRLQLHDQFTVRIEYIPTEDVPLYFAAADLVALPYREVYQSGVALMAMSYGLPVVASDLDGMRETIEDGRTGHLFRRCSAADLARTIDAALLHPERLGTIASNALREVAIERDWAVIGERTREVYERVLGQEKPLEPPPQPGRRGATTRQLRRRLLMLMATVGCVFWLGHEGGAAVGSTAATSIPEPAFASLAALGLVGLIALGIYGCRADQKEVV